MDPAIKSRADGHLAKTIHLWNRAISLISEEKFLAAEATILALLDNSPDFFPPFDTPPKIMAPFHKARRHFMSANQKNLTAKVLMAQATSQGISVTVEASDALWSLATQIILYIRTKEQAYFRSRSFAAAFNSQRRADFVAALPFKTATHVEYYIEFIGGYNAPFQFIGLHTEPLSLRVAH